MRTPRDAASAQARCRSCSVSCAPSSRALKRSAPRYTASAPLATAARTASREPAGARSSGTLSMRPNLTAGRSKGRWKSLKKQGRWSSALVSSALLQRSGFLRRQILQRVSHVALTETLQRTVAKLANPLAGDAQHLADLVERVFAARLQSEVEAEDLRVAGREGREGSGQLLRAKLIENRLLGVGHLLDGEPLDQRAVAVGAQRCVEPNVRGVERQ